MPSTTNSFPGYSCAVVRFVSMGLSFLQRGCRNFEADRLAEHGLERRDVAMGGPELQLDIAGRAQPREIIVRPRIQVDTRDRLRVAAVESLGQADDRRERLDRAAPRSAQIAVAVVRFLRCRLPMISGNEGDHLDLLGIEPPQVAVLDQVVGMTMVAFVADVDPDIVEQRPELEPVALLLAKAVHRARLIEDRQREPRDLLRVLGPVAAALTQLDHAAPADVGVALDLADARAVAP